MRVQELAIEFRLDGLNEIIDAARTHWTRSRDQKIEQQLIVKTFARKCKLQPVLGPFRLEFLWLEPNDKRDPDNIVGAKKFIFDALQEMKLIPNDNMKYVLGWTESWRVVAPQFAGVTIKIIED